MSNDSGSAGVKRRDFLKVLGAAGATASTVGCTSEKVGKLIPYLVHPDETVAGVSTYYATTCRECAASCGIIAETRDGRTTKLEGNPEHPLNRGALCARGQAAVQGLYNPDRFRGPMVKQNGAWRAVSWDDALTLLSQKLGEARSRGGAGNAIFLNQHETGSFPGFLDAWLGGFGMRPHLSVDFEADAAAIEANRRTYGVAWPRLSFADAKLIVSFGADFLETWGMSVPQQLDFADARAKAEGAPRFVYIGPRRSLTGLNADQWIACKPGTELVIANALRGSGSVADAARQSGVAEATLTRLQQELAAAKPALVLAGARGANALDLALAVAALNQTGGAVGTTIRPAEGSTAFEGIARFGEVADAVERMRAGQVPIAFVRGVNPAYVLPASAKFADAFAKVPFKVSFSLYPDETTELCDLVLPDLHSLESWGDAEAGRGTVSLQQPAMDPVFAGTRATADVLIQLAQKDPANAARYPAKDYRGWLMGRFPGGTAAFTATLQKGIGAGAVAPRTAAASAAPTARAVPAIDQTSGDFYLVAYPSPVLGGDGRGANKPWLQELPDPVSKVLWSSWVEIHPETANRLGIERGDIVEVATAAGKVRAPAYLYLGIRPDTLGVALGQGHGAAAKLDDYDGKHNDNVPTQWGYGRYARNIGVRAQDLLGVGTDGAGGFALVSTKATLTKTGDHDTLVSTEGSARQHGRGIAQALLVTELGATREAPGAENANALAPQGSKNQESGSGASHGEGAGGKGEGNRGEHHEEIPGEPPNEFRPGLRSPVAADAQGVLGAPTAENHGKDKGLYATNHWAGMANRRWAMTIDLARCTGCSACVTACYAENNIPTVGAPWQNATVFAVAKPGFNITRGREMNWLRLERYFEGADDGKFTEDFESRFVPMLCQHCGNAPCEPVCPVYATYHAPDGLNVQVYNRCVGTRYCSNNCPYKVRYFNWFGYGEEDRKQYAFPEPLNWQLNPDVTVRTKGVMEKCTFCVQRIREAETRAKSEGRTLVADEFTTACSQACPSRAIVFGDAADPTWTVSKQVEDRRAYHVFEELNTYTAVVYLKKVNHPGPATPAGA
ncbi:MAG: 4Fe-4S dicluster domain-containing protein [Gemmatimonadaceae bacterium]|nr:4Fe-4S dicluster domain-containing protein [Gemmatimonadaceae bacterium]NUR35142.1 4Fe-4S dicluster domain-containing protein [Gemmatimonadaceae bacterium]NUS47841.1 4Fe-4S dicluster domain-containing protein [Gemmatimonadaceae bacterium]